MMFVVVLMVVGVLSRFIVHIPNFTPIIAIFLFGGVYLPKKYALILPLAMFILSDMLIGFHETILFTYGSVVLISLLGLWLKEHKNFKNTLIVGLVSSGLFFIITNWGVWLVSSLYPHTLEGLTQCFVLAIPFFRNELISTFLYGALLFCGYELMTLRLKRVRVT